MIEFGLATLLLDFLEHFLVAVEGFHFFGDKGELFQFVDGLDRAAEEFPEAFEQELSMRVAQDSAVIMIAMSTEHFTSARFEMGLAKFVDLLEVRFVVPA